MFFSSDLPCNAVNLEKFKGKLKMMSGSMNGETMWLDYEDFCKRYE